MLSFFYKHLIKMVWTIAEQTTVCLGMYIIMGMDSDFED